LGGQPDTRKLVFFTKQEKGDTVDKAPLRGSREGEEEAEKWESEEKTVINVISDVAVRAQEQLTAYSFQGEKGGVGARGHER